MGATTFETVAEGRTAREAFSAARQQAEYEHGAGGYTGTIAEKHSFTEVHLPAAVLADTAQLRARLYELCDDPRFFDKWGPAGCVQLRAPTAEKPGRWVFFGWASE